MTTTAPVQPSEELHQHLAARLADACVNPSYMPDLWAVYFLRFREVLSGRVDRHDEGC
jgi:hypothetical protein